MYKATQTRIQTYLNDVAGVRIVCAFIDDIYMISDLITQQDDICLLYTSPSPRDRTRSRMPSSA